MLSLLGLAIYLALEFLRPEVLFPQMIDVPIMFWVAIATIVVWLIEMTIAGWPWEQLQSTRFFVAFLAVAMISSALNHASGQKLTNDFNDIGKLLCMYLIVVQSINSEGKLRFVLTVLMSLILVLVVEGIAFSQGWPIAGFRFDNQGRMEYSGIFRDSNDLGQIYAVGWTIILFHLVNGTGMLEKMADVVLLTLLAWAMLLTGSRGTMLAAIIGVFLSGRRSFGLVKPALVAFSIFVVMNQLGISRMNLFSSGETSAEERVIAWGQGWYMLRANPVFGVGPLNFHNYHPLAPHSTLVQVGAETGLIGLFCWVGLLYSPLRTTILNLLPGHGLEAGTTFRELQMQAALLVCLVSSMFLTRAYLFPIYLLLGLVLAAGRRTDAETEEIEDTQEVSEALLPMPVAVPWASWKQIAVAQIVCIAWWRIMARRFIDGI